MILLESEVASKVQTFAQKHPILLPNRNHLTDIIIRQVHKSNHHAGIQHTLATIRSNESCTPNIYEHMEATNDKPTALGIRYRFRWYILAKHSADVFTEGSNIVAHNG